MKTKLILTALFFSMICQAQLLTKDVDYTTDTMGIYTICTFIRPVILTDVSSIGGPFQNFVSVKNCTSLFFDNGKMQFQKENGLNTYDTTVSMTLIVLYNAAFGIYGNPIIIDTMAIRQRGLDLCSTDLKINKISNIIQQGNLIILSSPASINVFDLNGKLIQSEQNIQSLIINYPGVYVIKVESAQWNEVKKVIIH